nr:PREDICTED: V-set and immunoglobulin domain-containing protein 10-like [Pundamilia nyererei]
MVTQLLGYILTGARCELLVSPAGPSLVNALAGENVTLAVSFSGAPDPVVKYIQSLTLSSQPGLIKEGTENFTLQHSMLQGVFEQQMWFFNGIEIKNSSRYLVKTQANSLVILRPNRNDTGEYAVLLTNPFRNATASQNVSVQCGPVAFLPIMRTTVDSGGKIVVTVRCFSEVSPKAVVSWFSSNETVTNGSTYQISSNTSQLMIRHYNVSNFLLQNYTCTCRNPLGSKKREIQLQGPSISDSSLFPNRNGTIVTLTWEVPSMSVVTGFDIQMKGPDLLSKNRNAPLTKSSSNVYRTIQQKPGSARSTDIFFLDPKLTYWFQVIPKARMTNGEPSKSQRIGPGEGLSGPAIAGIAAGIPCSLLFLLLLTGLIYLGVYCIRNKSR